MTDRITREREFHNKRFDENPDRSRSLKRAMSPITCDALQEVFAEAQKYCCQADVLDYGCAEGEASLILNKHGARTVTGIDISDVAIEKARQEAAERQAGNTEFHVMNAERLSFPDASFDLVFGIGILHHLHLERSISEIARVTRPDGRAIFLEPLGHNPAVNLFRRMTPSIRTVDEHPLLVRDFEHFRNHFHDVRLRSKNLATLATVPIFWMPGVGFVRRGCQLADRYLFSLVPFLKRFAWNVIITLSHPDLEKRGMS